MKRIKIVVGPKAKLREPIARGSADIWRSLAGEQDLHVPDDKERLVEWVERIARARNWPVERIESVRDRFAKGYPHLAEFVDELFPSGDLEEINDLYHLARHHLPELPESISPARAHAERIARLLLREGFASRLGRPALRALFVEALGQLTARTNEQLYWEIPQLAAETVLERLAGSAEPCLGCTFEPVAEPWVTQALQDWLRRRLLEGDLEAIQRSLRQPVSATVSAIIARELVRLQPEQGVSRELAEAACRFLDSDQQRLLKRLVEQPFPSSLPPAAEGWSVWFERSYLPYRQWLDATGAEPPDTLRSLWSTFEEAVLAETRRSLSRGNGPTALHRSAALKRTHEGRTLVVVLDGPRPEDADLFLRRLQEEDDRWTCTTREWVLAPIPTVTEVGRPTIANGRPAKDGNSDEAASSVAAAEACFLRGDRLVFLKLSQPDKAYHDPTVAPERLVRLAEAQLQVAAKEVADLLRKDACDVVYLTADHGRCYGRCEPRLKAPSGDVQGRAVLKVPRGSQLADGLRRLEGDVYLFSDRDDAAVAQGDACFEGSTQLWYLHGGLLPEEVLVPWRCLEKVPEEIRIEGEAVLRGIAGRHGVLELELKNLSSFDLELSSIAMGTGHGDIDLAPSQTRVPRASAQRIGPFALDRPPSSVPDKVTLTVCAPDGRIRTLELPLRSDLKTLQHQSIRLLDDL